jgi:hypothetical protein
MRLSNSKSRTVGAIGFIFGILFFYFYWFTDSHIPDVAAFGAFAVVMACLWASNRLMDTDNRRVCSWSTLGGEARPLTATIWLGRLGLGLMISAILPLLLFTSRVFQAGASPLLLTLVVALFLIGVVVWILAKRRYNRIARQIVPNLSGNERLPYF